MADHDHHHDHSELGHQQDITNISGKKIFLVTLLNAIITISEIIGGLVSGSLSLLSDAVHNLSDTIAIALSYYANRIAKKPNDSKKTYGYQRAEILSAFVNASVLFAISSLLIIESIKRWQNPEVIDGKLMIIVASIGLVANLISVFLLEKDSHENLNIKSSYLHLLSDTISSIGVVLGGIAIMIWDVLWVDPLITMLISLYILRETWHVVKKTIEILMQSSAKLDYYSIKEDVEKISGVNTIHHVHSWMINENTIHFEAHIDIDDMLISEVQDIYDKINHYLKEHYDISHTTLQAEVDQCQDKSFFKQ